MATVVKCNNGVVTDTYMELIGKALSYSERVRYCRDMRECVAICPKTETIVVARTVDAFRAILRGYKKIVVWFQGVEPEESYMAHHSKLRRSVLSTMERIILKRGEFFFFVSKAMKRHYESKYRITIDEDNCYIMPCQNTVFHPESFATAGKYSSNIYTYVGSLAVWQKFDETIRLYKEIEKMGLPNTELRVFTFDQDMAREMLRDAGVQHYSVGCVRNEDMPCVLADIKYGFIIREDNIVNRVATPTKISTYMSCGVIPIYSDCLEGFSEAARQLKYAIKNDEKKIEKIRQLSFVDYKDIEKEYKEFFDIHYSGEKHIEQLKPKLSKIQQRISK